MIDESLALAQQYRGYADRGYEPWEYAFYTAREEITAVAILTLVVTGFLVFVFFRSRTKVAGKRLDVLEKLAQGGHVSQAQVAEFLRPAKRFVTLVLLAAWFALLGGGALLVAALAEGWPDRYCEFGAPSLALIGGALAAISAPIMLREFRRQGIA